MRTVTINGNEVAIVGSAITPWIYEQEFDGGDMAADLSTFQPSKGRKLEPRLVALPKMAWAMARCAKYPSEFPDFPTWLGQVGGFDYSDELLIQGVVFEAMKGCFPGKKALVSRAEDELEAKRAEAQAASERAGVGEADEAVAD